MGRYYHRLCCEYWSMYLRVFFFLFFFLSHYCSGFCSGSDMDFMEGSWNEINGMHTKNGCNSSSNSNNSSISSISSSSSDSDHKMTTGASELEGDADSLTCRQSGLTSNDQLENDCPKLVLCYLQSK